mmetsp:Transcript_8581/g.7918  ORF Transcript_8581/g.7918 Transcript_8581/m.7918 type:complete len:149 (-) Transcript_8581:590-1036(-)|eukprot:CAMPEP_0170563774 /NCGR_PEP_ID=MMETSP0211-20121228/68883_1 /TAXON_ID=311385 /ORGANISM="Pseudokeronopsis sp., Strain OXSARD2" /LENGTH=148 /DNA_ID=CAMNT_0010882437 /DNA_START=68 /DNA_END=514 /DNA_ORIENTATION=+
MAGLEHIHKNGYAHRNIKLQNLLISSDLTLKLSGFFMAGDLAGKDDSGMMQTLLGTIGYTAPEIRAKQRYLGDRVDLFSAGVALFILVSRHPPFKEAFESDLHYRYLIHKKTQEFWKIHSRDKEGGMGFYSPEFRDLIEKLLEYKGKD